MKSRAWFALYTRHQHEKAVAQLLCRKGVEIFLPLYNAAHRWKDRIKQLSLPLFPNYVFVLAGYDRNIDIDILQTPGIYDFVRRGGLPAPIPGEEIDAVRRVVERGLSVEPHPFLKSGDRARVKSGPLEGLEGILIRKKNFHRLVLSVDLLLRSISVEVEVTDIERVMSRHVGSAFAATPVGLASGG